VLVVVAIALSSWQAGQTRDAPGAHRTVLAVVAVAFVMTAVLGWGRQRLTARRWVGAVTRWVRTWRAQPRAVVISVAIWTVLITGVIAWDLTSFAVQSHMLPTLSYFIGHVTRYRIGRGALFFSWLGAGAYIVAAARTRVTQ
jgi:hypothetical protein